MSGCVKKDNAARGALGFALRAVLRFSFIREMSEEKTLSLYTVTLSADQAASLRALLESQGSWQPYEVTHAAFAFKGDKVNVVCYTSGKAVIQGKRTREFVSDTLEPFVTLKPVLGYEEIHHPEWFETHAGLDESGKGDLFGPVVSATVIADESAIKKWLVAGVRDSKSVSSDAAVLKLDKLICETPGVAVKRMRFDMPKYNELYKKFGGNLNRLLAWMHARTLEAALKEKPAPRGLLDQFSTQPLVQRALKDVPENFNLEMRTKAEDDPVVAAASIVARAEYVRSLKALSEQAGEELLKGASAAVKAQAKRIVEKKGADALGNFAKLHFRTAYEALGLPAPEKKQWVARGKKDLL